MVPTARLLLVQPPPPVLLSNAVVEPTQTVSAPVIGEGTVLTVTIVEAVQPVEAVYTIVDVPIAAPVTIPVGLIGATVGLLLLQVPPRVASLNVVVVPTHKPVEPVIGSAPSVTVITLVVWQPVGKI